jgi:thiamine transport system substrate-binding protein
LSGVPQVVSHATARGFFVCIYRETAMALKCSRLRQRAGAVSTALSLVSMTLAACMVSLSFSAHAGDKPELRVVAHDSFSLPKALISDFEASSGTTVRIVKAGDAGAMLNKLILTKATPIGDVVFGIDNAMLARARAAGLLAPLPQSLRELAISDAVLAADPQAAAASDWLPIDYGFVTINYDRAWFTTNKVALPTSLDDLANPDYAKLLVVQNPATSSPGFAFLAATVQAKDKAVWDWWAKLRAGGVKVSSSWSDAYYKDFTKNGGTRPMVVSYLSSPAAEVFYSDKPLEVSPTGNLNLLGGVYVQIEGAALLTGGQQAPAGAAFLAFLRSPPVQAELQTTMWMWPVQQGAAKHAVMSHSGVQPTAQAIDQRVLMEQSRTWIRQFTQTVLR